MCIQQLLRLRALFQQLAPDLDQLLCDQQHAHHQPAHQHQHQDQHLQHRNPGGRRTTSASAATSTSAFSTPTGSRRPHNRDYHQGRQPSSSAADAAAADPAQPPSWSSVSISAKVLTHIGEELQEAQDLLLNMLDPHQVGARGVPWRHGEECCLCVCACSELVAAGRTALRA